jgi:hypothetical protein
MTHLLKLIEIVPIFCWTSLGFYTVHRFTIPVNKEDDTNIYINKLNKIIDKTDNIESKISRLK